jgi:hypothetical protein
MRHEKYIGELVLDALNFMDLLVRAAAKRRTLGKSYRRGSAERGASSKPVTRPTWMSSLWFRVARATPR